MTQPVLEGEKTANAAMRPGIQLKASVLWLGLECYRVPACLGANWQKLFAVARCFARDEASNRTANDNDLWKEMTMVFRSHRWFQMSQWTP